MGYKNVEKKIDELEQKGFIKPISSNKASIKSQNCGYIHRWSEHSDKNTNKYLVEKIKNFLIEEEVIFNLSEKETYFVIQVMPHKELEYAINESKSYSEMKNKLNKIPFIKLHRSEFDKDKGIHIEKAGVPYEILYSIAKFENALIYIKKDYIEVTTRFSEFYIKSEKCENFKKSKKIIDTLF